MNLNKEKIKKNRVSALVHDDRLRAEVKQCVDGIGYSMGKLCERLRELEVTINKQRLSRYLSLGGEENGLTDENLIALCKFLGISVELKIRVKALTEEQRVKETMEYVNGLKKIREVPRPGFGNDGPKFDPDEEF